jgi:hypothetical protein
VFVSTISPSNISVPIVMISAEGMTTHLARVANFWSGSCFAIYG